MGGNIWKAHKSIFKVEKNSLYQQAPHSLQAEDLSGCMLHATTTLMFV